MILPGEDSSVHGWMEGFNSPSKYFGAAGKLGDIFDSKTGLSEAFCGASAAYEGKPELDEASTQWNQTRFVGNGEKCCKTWSVFEKY